MLSEDGTYVLCQESVNGCEQKYLNTKQGRMHSFKLGWAFTWVTISRNEKSWCPDHTPPWYNPWNHTEGIPRSIRRKRRSAFKKPRE